MNALRKWACLSVLLLMTGEVEAGITGVSFSGPGGSGFADFSQDNHLEAIFDIDYNHAAYENIAVTVDSAGSYTFFATPPDFYVLNVSGETWKAFTFASDSGAVFTSANETPDPYNGPAPGSDHFADISVTSSLVTYSGGTGVVWDPSDPNKYSLTFYPKFTFMTTSAGTFNITATPLLTSVPEPSSLVLLGSGAIIGLGIVHCSRRRRSH